jgi:crossover junction endodeoxyribonuclease RuvC
VILGSNSVALAFDLATNAGWCGGPRTSPRVGSVALAPDDPHPARGCALLDWLDDYACSFDPASGLPALIVHTSPYIPSRASSQHAGALAHGLTMALGMWCWRRQVRCMKATDNQVRKIVFGRGDCSKAFVFAECRKAGLDPPDMDASDAWAIWRAAFMVRGDIPSP